MKRIFKWTRDGYLFDDSVDSTKIEFTTADFTRKGALVTGGPVLELQETSEAGRELWPEQVEFGEPYGEEIEPGAHHDRNRASSASQIAILRDSLEIEQQEAAARSLLQDDTWAGRRAVMEWLAQRRDAYAPIWAFRAVYLLLDESLASSLAKRAFENESPACRFAALGLLHRMRPSRARELASIAINDEPDPALRSALADFVAENQQPK
jgi:hypothetical protein